MMNQSSKMKGCTMLAYTLFLGPLFLTLHFRAMHRTYPAARYFAWTSLLALALCTALSFSLAVSPSIIRFAYLAALLSIFGLAFFYCWGLDAKTQVRKPGPKDNYSLSRALAWMVVMAILFSGLNNVVQAAYYWLLGEYVGVYFSAQANLFKLWGLVGLVCGFFYGIRKSNDYFSRNLPAVAKSVVFVLVFIFLYSGIVLALVIYPFQRLAPISYYPGAGEYLLFLLVFIAACLSGIYLLRRVGDQGILRAGLVLLIGIPVIAVHVIVVSAYSTTINLTAASLLEDRQEISAAKKLYAKVIPHIRHDHVLASLHHRQGVLQVLNQDYESAAASFRKVLADYSENFEAFRKSDRYLEALERNKSATASGRKILAVRHQTFEQAASCFPNSLSVILHFYAQQPVSTRELSYAIKESFATGTFIWKAESFLDKNGYSLLTTFWQDKNTLISLLEADYPILVFVPGHVYTLYGYDSRVEMFLTYDTAKSNRWDDKPFWNLQQDWMKSSFLMSVVVPKGSKREFAERFPKFTRYAPIYQEWQRAHISDYYESKGSYWKDYDRYALSAAFGLDRLKMSEPYFLHDDFFAFRWDVEDWKNEVQPVLMQPWALDWSIVEKYILYLIYSGQAERALWLIEDYQGRLPAAANAPFLERLQFPFNFPAGPDSIYSQALELKLAAAVEADISKEVLSASEKLIGITGNRHSESYWGHYFKARYLMASGDLSGAAELLLSALQNLRLDIRSPSGSFSYIVEALNEIHQIAPGVIRPEKMALIKIAWVTLLADG